MNDESKQKLALTVRYGLLSEIIQIIFSFAVRSNKVASIEEIGEWMNRFFTSLSEEERDSCRQEIMEMIKEKEDSFRLELSKKMSEAEIAEVMEIVKPENIFSQSR